MYILFLTRVLLKVIDLLPRKIKTPLRLSISENSQTVSHTHPCSQKEFMLQIPHKTLRGGVEEMEYYSL